MQIPDYKTAGGKNKEYLSEFPTAERAIGYSIRHKIVTSGLQALDELNPAG